MSGVTNSFLRMSNQGFNILKLDGLDSGQLKERLLVAETLMKKLYNRTKELEEFLRSS